ncbi:MAG TPA: sigma-70 family RNA polymerase sigma factor [Trebonia sp.]|nr:sigma-70 family RNA polymerase sigma factor [Trebonia sp.]
MRDSEVVASIVAGDPDGLAAAYDRYADSLYTYCRSMLKDQADAADAVQDTFVIAASRLDGLRDPERLRAWLYSVARNECLRILRAKKNTSGLDEAPEVTDTTADVSQDAERADLRALLQDASEGLNPGEREVIELQLRQGLEAAEVATVLGVSRNHAHSLLSRARDQLEACLGVLLVGRAGQDDCDELGTMLTGWDGRLTVLLRKRLNRHIEHCQTCTSRKALVLHPAAFLGVAPVAALAAAAAEGIRLAPHAPAALKGHVLTLATSTGPTAAAHRAAVLSRAGSFGKAGFPKPLHAAKAGLLHGAGGGKAGFLKSPQGQAAAAAVVLAVIVASTAFALTANNGTHHPALSASKPPGNSAGGGGGGAAPPPSSHKSKPKPKPPASHPAPASQPPPSAAPPPAPAPTTAAPTSAPPSTAPPRTPSSPASPPPTTPAPTPSPSQSTAPPGTLAAYPAGGFITIPSGGTTITLTAEGGAVSWDIAQTGGTGTVSVSPSSGTLKPGASSTVTVTASELAAGQTLTISPGSTTYVVLVGWGKQPGLPTALPLPLVPLPSSIASLPPLKREDS